MITTTWRCICAPPGNSSIALAAAQVYNAGAVVLVYVNKRQRHQVHKGLLQCHDRLPTHRWSDVCAGRGCLKGEHGGHQLLDWLCNKYSLTYLMQITRCWKRSATFESPLFQVRGYGLVIHLLSLGCLLHHDYLDLFQTELPPFRKGPYFIIYFLSRGWSTGW